MKTVLITGVSRGLGKALFHLFISKGYLVFGVLRNQSEARRLELELPDNARLILCDLSSDESIDTIRNTVKDSPIDLLINNAGIAGKSFLIDEVVSEEISDLFNVHCLGAFRTVKSLKSNLLKAERPMVLNLNSRLGSISRQSNGTYQNLSISYSYRIAKAAQNMLTNCLRSEFKDSIQFISLHPGRMKTEIASTDADLEPKEVAAKILNAFEQGNLKEEHGIIELEKEVIEW
jgi:NAD(P)-dependent dehydrogenase (short-subunit alcohol dehydrogenase family)